MSYHASPEPPAPDPLLTVDEVAAELRTTPRHIRRLIAERRVRFVKVGYFVRIPLSAIDEFVAKGTVEAAQ